MSMCRVFCCVVGRGSLLWPVCSLGKPLVAFALLHSVLQRQSCLLLQMFLDFLLLHSSLLWRKEHLLGVLVLEGLHRTVQLQLLQHYWLGHRLGLLWYWVVCLENEQRSFCRFEIVYQHTVVTVPQWCCQTTKHRTFLISHPVAQLCWLPRACSSVWVRLATTWYKLASTGMTRTTWPGCGPLRWPQGCSPPEVHALVQSPPTEQRASCIE